MLGLGWFAASAQQHAQGEPLFAGFARQSGDVENGDAATTAGEQPKVRELTQDLGGRFP
jgi:hypothetical protein